MKRNKRVKPSSAPDASAGRQHYEHKIPSREQILAALEGAGKPLPLPQLAEVLEIASGPHSRALENRLKAMVRDGQLIRNRARGYCLTGHLDLVSGRVIAHRDGFGFLRPDDGSDDLYLSARQMVALWDGDRVAVRATDSRRGGREGHVVEVLQRGRTEVVGALRRERGIDYVLQEGDTTSEILIARGQRGKARPGDIVRVEILEYPTQRSVAIGRVVAVVGQAYQPGIETDVAILSHDIPSEWPQAVIDEAAAIPGAVPTAAKRGRVDLRDLPLVTIDGADARDFDDAVYCEADGRTWRLIVAIADVAHYVGIDTPLDREARIRGTSVYFPDRVVPMLPEALSNGLCSLNPKVDRLCLVCDMRVSANGSVSSSTFYEGVMRSSARLTYTEAWSVLSDAAVRRQRPDTFRVLEPLQQVYRALSAARRRRGAIDFDLPETKIELGEDGQVASVRPVVRVETHKIIEECMIAANVEAAKRLRKTRMPTLFRVHEGPDPDRIEELFLFLKTFGVNLPPVSKLQSRDLSRVIEQLESRPEAELIDAMILRTMSQAKYQPKNVGHFGLALDAYAHFTSPIRRYPDLLVHRALKWLIGHESSKGFAYSLAEMTQLGEQTSRAERRADEAVWDVEEQLKCVYMKARVGECFDAIVSSVVPFGVFVRIPSLAVDGLVHVSALPSDYYHREASGVALVGERTGQRFGLTDPLRVRLTHVDLEQRKIDFVPEGNAASGGAGRRPARRGRRA